LTDIDLDYSIKTDESLAQTERKPVNVDIEKMSRETGISVVQIRPVLGLWPERRPINNLLDAQRTFFLASKQSELADWAMKKWLQFCISFDQAQYAFVCASNFESRSRMVIPAMKKWLSFCNCFDAARVAFCIASGRGAGEDMAMKKWLQFCTTLEQTLEAFEKAPDGSRAGDLAIRKLATFFPKKRK